MRWAFRVVVLVTLASCGEDVSPGTAGSSNAPPAVIRTDPASATDCANGGSVVLAGADRNGNAVLDDDEVQTRAAVCNPPPASPTPATVVRLVDEPGGANCAEGGTAVQTGPDRNGNGQLDDDEVAHVDYACGDRLLTRIASEPAGANCAAGGIAVEAGPDRDHDGALGDDEVEHTDYVCGDVLSRSVTVHSTADAAALANITAIEGTLTIDPAVFPDDGELALPKLQHVRDFLWVLDTTHLTKLHLPKLEEVAGYVSVARNASLTVLDTPVLRQVGNSIFIGDNPKLQDLEQLRQLDLVGADLTVRNNAALTSLPLAGPTIGGTLDIELNPALSTLDMFFVDRLDRVIIDRNGLTTLKLSGFALHRPKTTLGSLQVTNNPALTDLDVLINQLGDVTIAGNASLVHTTLATDEVMGDVVVQDDPSLGELYLFKNSSPDAMLELHGALSVAAPIRHFGGALYGVSIDGPLTLDGTHLTSLRLIGVGGTLRLAHNTALTGDIIITDRLGGGLEVIENPVLDHLFLWTQPSVINGNVIVTGNPKLASTQVLNTVQTVQGSVTIADNAALIEAWTGVLANVSGYYTLASNPVLTSFSLEKLESARGVTVVNNDALPALALPALSNAQNIRIDSNGIAQLAMPRLEINATTTVTNNRQLPTCEVEAIFAKIPSSVTRQFNNNDAGTCP